MAFTEGPGPWGPEQLIKMATGQLPDACGMRLQPPANGDTCETSNALDYRDRAGSVRTPRLGSYAGSYAEWTVNLFSQCRVI